MSALLDLGLVAALILTGARALWALPWTDAEILAVHRAARALTRPRPTPHKTRSAPARPRGTA